MRKMTGLVLCAGIAGIGVATATPAAAVDVNTSSTQYTAASFAEVVSKSARVDEPVTPMAGDATFRRGGLTCKTEWRNTGGSANCFKNNNGQDPNQRWRAHYRCQFQPDFYSTWQRGPGKHGSECNFGIQGVDIQWG